MLSNRLYMLINMLGVCNKLVESQKDYIEYYNYIINNVLKCFLV